MSEIIENQTWIDEVPDKIVWNMYHDARNWCCCHDFNCDRDIEHAHKFEFGWRFYCDTHLFEWYGGSIDEN